MDEEWLAAYVGLIQRLLACPGGEEHAILNQSMELADAGFVQVCEQGAAQLQAAGEENGAAFLRDLAQQVGAFLAGQGTGGSQLAALQQLWEQLLQGGMQGGADAVHRVMQQNMGLITPSLGDVIAQSIPRLLAQNPGQAEGVAGVVQNTCIYISNFPEGRYAEMQEIAIRGYGVVLALWADNPEKQAQTLTNLGVARWTQAERGIATPAMALQP